MELAFEAAVERHGPTVLRVCRAVLGSGPDADDAWSETFLSALRAWEGLDPGTDLEAWLVRVAHRRAVDVVRRSSRAATPTGTDGDLDVLAGRSPSPARDRGPGERGEDRALWETVAALPAKQRLCVAYHYLGGLSYRETAEIIGGTEAAARRAAADGVAALRRNGEDWR